MVNKMKLVRCPYRHYYDVEEEKDCPECRKNKFIQSPEKKEKIKQNVQIIIEKQEPDYNEEDIVTVLEKQNLDSDSDVTTLLMKENNLESVTPVVGWLVCIEGIYFGESFALKTGRNLIEVSPDMPVLLSNSVQMISETAPCIIFDTQTQQFQLIPEPEQQNIYLNQNLLLSPEFLQDYDKIQTENNSYVFRSFCNANFKWE